MWLALGSALLCGSTSCTQPTFANGRDGGAEARDDESTAPERSDGGAMVVSPAGDAARPAQADGAPGLPLDPEAGLTESDGAPRAPGAATDADADADAESPSPEAAMSGDAAAGDLIPEWARALIGTYAKRTVTFSYDDAGSSPIQTRNVDHALVRIADEGGELVVTIQMCSYNVSIKGQNSSPLDFRNARQFPTLRGRLTVTAPNTFSSEVMLQHFGFDPSRGTSCGAAGRRTKFDDQTWISGANCQCYPTVLPADIDDCRILDGDRDRLAGVTARAPSALGTMISDYLMVFDYSVKIADGKLLPDQLPAWREVRAQGASCINAERDRCFIGNNELCPGSSTSLLRAPREATCAELDPGAFGPLETFPPETDCRTRQAP